MVVSRTGIKPSLKRCELSSPYPLPFEFSASTIAAMSFENDPTMATWIQLGIYLELSARRQSVAHALSNYVSLPLLTNDGSPFSERRMYWARCIAALVSDMPLPDTISNSAYLAYAELGDRITHGMASQAARGNLMTVGRRYAIWIAELEDAVNGVRQVLDPLPLVWPGSDSGTNPKTVVILEQKEGSQRNFGTRELCEPMICVLSYRVLISRLCVIASPFERDGF